MVIIVIKSAKYTESNSKLKYFVAFNYIFLFSRLNQESGLITLMPTVGQLEEEVDYVPVKTRSTTPDGSSGGPYWLPPSGANVGGTPRHPMDGCGETGFINSQPSMAEVRMILLFFYYNDISTSFFI